MPTPTVSEILALRRDVGDLTPDILVDSADIAMLWDDAGGDAALARYYALRRMVAVLTGMLGRCKDEDDRDNVMERLRATRELLGFWKAEAGVYGGSLRTGVIDLDLDVDGD